MPVQTTSRRRPSLMGYLLTGLMGGLVLCVVATAGFGIAALGVLLGADIQGMGAADLLVAIPAIFVSYLVLGLLAAVALWVLYPLPDSALGWVPRGAILAPIVYGVVGLTSVLLYDRLGVNIMDFQSVDDAWDFLWWSLPFFSVVGALGAPVVHLREKG